MAGEEQQFCNRIPLERPVLMFFSLKSRYETSSCCRVLSVLAKLQSDALIREE